MFVQEVAPYPPPHLFAAGIGEAGLREAIARSNDDPIPKAITLAIVIPRSRDAARAGDIARLFREIDTLAHLVDRDRGIAELIIDASGAERPLRGFPWSDLLAAIEHQFYVGPGTGRAILADVAAGPIEPEDIGVLKAAGFNRLSLVTAHNGPGLVRTAQRCGFGTTGVALEYPLRDDDFCGLQQAVDSLVAARPDRLEIRPPAWGVGQDDVLGDALRGNIEAVGYTFIGPGQYALDFDELALGSRAGCLRFGVFGYTAAPDCDLMGVGPDAISQVGDCLARNAAGLADWRQEIDSGRLPVLQGVILTDEDRIRDAVMQSLLCRRMIPVLELEAAFGIEFRRRFAPELARLAGLPAARFLSDSGDRIEVCSPGWPWLRTMARCFNAYACQQGPRRDARGR